ncbi:MAG: hypothetical protein IJA17_07895 [Oscillospiraceae bacterium]|nr:hypothetical protein [Oscillospiraceae bacterium]
MLAIKNDWGILYGLSADVNLTDLLSIAFTVGADIIRPFKNSAECKGTPHPALSATFPSRGRLFSFLRNIFRPNRTYILKMRKTVV